MVLGARLGAYAAGFAFLYESRFAPDVFQAVEGAYGDA